jgi:hypothetical protein
MEDATGREIVIGRRYGYSQQQNGAVRIVTGIVEKMDKNKVTLGSIKEKSGLWGSMRGEFKEETRRRSVNACHIFPVHDFIIGDKVITEYYDNEVFEVVGVLEDELVLKGDWSGGTHNVSQVGNYDRTKCRLK